MAVRPLRLEDKKGVYACFLLTRYNKLWKAYVKLRHLMAYQTKVTSEDRQKLKTKEEQLQNLRLKR